MSKVLEGREDRGKYNIRKGRMDEHASTTNREKSKLKNPMMLKNSQKARSKKFQSMFKWAVSSKECVIGVHKRRKKKRMK
jgi:protein SDA1